MSANAFAAGHGGRTLLTNADFSDGADPWIAGSNLFGGNGAIWREFRILDTEERITRGSGSVTFNSYDDGESDVVESFLFQEFTAGPSTSPWPTVFSTDDAIVFRGTARATQTGTNTVVRAFIKTLGYNDLGWEFQTKDEYSQFFPLTAADQDFELSITYPDLEVDDSLQVIQIGFEITTRFAGGDMGTGTITFSNLQAFVEGDDEPEPQMWLGYEMDASGWVDTGDFLGSVWAGAAPWIWSLSLQKWMYLPATEPSEGGEWVHLMK